MPRSRTINDSGFGIRSEDVGGVANARANFGRKAGFAIGNQARDFEPGGDGAENREKTQGELFVAGDGAENERDAEFPEVTRDAPTDDGQVVSQIELHFLMQFGGDRENFFGEVDILFPSLEMCAEAVGMPRLEMPGVNKVDVVGDEARFAGGLQI